MGFITPEKGCFGTIAKDTFELNTSLCTIFFVKTHLILLDAKLFGIDPIHR